MKKVLLMIAMMFVTSSIASDKSQWAYKPGKQGPCHWGTVYPTCKKGKAQSPINIITKKTQKMSKRHDIVIHEETHAVLSHEVDNGHAIKIIPAGDSGIELHGVHYKLMQYHFHGRSEHTVDGEPFDMVMHMVHQNKKGELAVLGVFMERGKHNKDLESLIDHLDGGDIKVAPASLLPKDLTHYYHYMGSLTTPPCSENVKWYILKDPINLDGIQLAKFRKHYTTNFRPIQRTNGRIVEVH